MNEAALPGIYIHEEDGHRSLWAQLTDGVGAMYEAHLSQASSKDEPQLLAAGRVHINNRMLWALVVRTAPIDVQVYLVTPPCGTRSSQATLEPFSMNTAGITAGQQPCPIVCVDNQQQVHLAPFAGGGYLLFRVYNSHAISLIDASDDGDIITPFTGHDGDTIINHTTVHNSHTEHGLYCISAGGREDLDKGRHLTQVVALVPHTDFSIASYIVAEMLADGSYRISSIRQHGADANNPPRIIMDTFASPAVPELHVGDGTTDIIVITNNERKLYRFRGFDYRSKQPILTLESTVTIAA